MNQINSTLPVSMKVLEKSGFSRYILLLNHKKIQTKSLINLELGAEYLAEIYEKNGALEFRNLSKKQDFAHFEKGLNLILEILENKIDFKKEIVRGILQAKTREEYEIYKEILLASFKNIYHIPFVFENKTCLFQLKQLQNSFELYLYFSVFGAIKIINQNGEITFFTPFAKVKNFLNRLNFNIFQAKFSPLFEKVRFLNE